MSKQHNLESIVENILQVWNLNCDNNNIDKVYLVSTNFRVKKLQIADKNNIVHRGNVDICELCLVESTKDGNLKKLLYRTEFPVEGAKPKNFKGSDYEYKSLVTYKCLTEVYNSFLYECIGSFCATSSKFFSEKQIAEYDLDLDRIKGDEGYKGIWIEVDKADETTWYKVGDKYEVFTQTPNNNWGVYSYRQDHKNGIGQIPLIHAKLIKDEVDIRKEQLLDEMKETTKTINATLGSIENKIEKTKVAKKVPVKRTTKTK